MSAKRMRRNSVAIITMTVLILTVLVTAPCQGASGGEIVLKSRSSQGRLGTLHLQNAPLRTMTSVPMVLRLSDREATPVSNAEVHCALTMPAMAMPENRPKMTASAGGYAGEAVFTMAGAWRATFGLILPSGEQDKIAFDIEGVLLK